MDRNKCERLLEQKARELIDIYHQYNPDGNYLSITYINDGGDGTVNIYNRYWKADDELDMENGEDIDLPINISTKAPLKIETSPAGIGTVQKSVTGFSEEEFDEIAELYDSGDKQAAENLALEILDKRNWNIGSCWHNGYGVYGFSVGTAGCTFTIGSSCD